MNTLRRFIAIALLAIFGLPLASSLLALTPKSEANLPACCRRNGKHHCMTSMTKRGAMADRSPHFSTPKEKCPYSPTAIMVGHPIPLGSPFSHGIFVGLTTQPAVVAQAESMRRISRDRSRQKRGPPVVL